MKNRGVKISLIIVLSIIAIILINFMVYVIINKDKDFKVSFIKFGDNTEKIFEKEYDSERFESVNINVSSSNVKIEKTDTDKIKITAYGDKDEKIEESINENELSISKENTKIFIFTMFYWCKEEIIVEIPNDCDKEFKIHTSSGDIIAPNLESNNIQFETSSGKIECNNINNGILQSSSGDISIGNGNEITLKTSSGDITAGNFNSLTAEASSGEISVNSIKDYCQLKTSSGNIKIDTLNITENSSINAKSGNVNISNINDIYVETETGSGDEDIQNNNRMSEIVLKITTTSGNIRVD